MVNNIIKIRLAISHNMFEFLRYLLIGGIAFVIDFTILFLTKKFIFYNMGTSGILLAAALGFTAGLIFNFIFSFIFVFKQVNENAKKNKIRSFILFALTGIMGLLLTELFMYLGVIIFGEKWHLIVKIFTTVVVLFWNYLSRKILIFKEVKYE